MGCLHPLLLCFRYPSIPSRVVRFPSLPSGRAVTGQRSNQLNYVPTRQVDEMKHPALVRISPLTTENILTASSAAGKGGPFAKRSHNSVARNSRTLNLSSLSSHDSADKVCPSGPRPCIARILIPKKVNVMHALFLLKTLEAGRRAAMPEPCMRRQRENNVRWEERTE
jgi:hypothetical protein